MTVFFAYNTYRLDSKLAEAGMPLPMQRKQAVPHASVDTQNDAVSSIIQ